MSEKTTKLKYTKRNWKVGVRDIGTVVSIDDGNHEEEEHYGGRLVAESIRVKDDRFLIAAAPDMLDACQACKAVFAGMGLTEQHETYGPMIERINYAINKSKP